MRYRQMIVMYSVMLCCLAVLAVLGVVFGYLLTISPVLVAQPRQPPPVPTSVMLYESTKERLPASRFDLNLDTLVTRATHAGISTFYAVPTDRLPPPQPVEHAKPYWLAYGGWCRAGIEDRTGPHFSQSLMPHITIVEYQEAIVVYANNYLKSGVQPTPEDLLAAETFFHNPPADWDVRPSQPIPLFPPDWEQYIPLRRTMQSRGR